MLNQTDAQAPRNRKVLVCDDFQSSFCCSFFPRRPEHPDLDESKNRGKKSDH